MHKTWWRDVQTPHPMRLDLAGHVHTTAAQAEPEGNRARVRAELTTA